MDPEPQRAGTVHGPRRRTCRLVLTREPELIGTDPFYPAFMAGIEAVISETGDGLMLQMSRPGDKVETYRRLAADQRVDGVFLTDLRQDDQAGTGDKSACPQSLSARSKRTPTCRR